MDVTKIPYIGPIIGMAEDIPFKFYRRCNAIVDYFEFYCDPSLYVYVETLLPLLGDFVLALLSFGWDDVLRGYLRPTSLRARSAIAGSIWEEIFGGGIPEFGEIIGSRLPGAKLIKANKVWQKTKALWVIDAAIQKVLFWWMIIDLVSDLFANWMTAVLRRAPGECQGFWTRKGYWTDAARFDYFAPALHGEPIRDKDRLGCAQLVSVGAKFYDEGAILVNQEFGTWNGRGVARLEFYWEGQRIDLSPWEYFDTTKPAELTSVARIPGPGYVEVWVRAHLFEYGFPYVVYQGGGEWAGYCYKSK